MQVEKYTWFENGEPTRELIKDGTRLLLVIVFLVIAFLVYKSWKKKNYMSK